MTDPMTRLPDDLEAVPPGPRLATLLASVRRSDLDARDRVRLARARNRQASYDQAELLADLYALAPDHAPARDPAAGEPARHTAVDRPAPAPP